MISINLLPPEYRKEKQVSLSSILRNKKFRNGAGIFFTFLTLIFYIQYQWGLGTLRQLQEEEGSLAKDVQRVNELKTEIEQGSKSEKEFLERYVTSPLPTTAILSAVSILLPESVWLLELKISRGPNENTFLLKGLSLPISHYSSIQDIEKYLRDLKEKFPPKTELILTTSRQVKENKELTLFTAVFKWV